MLHMLCLLIITSKIHLKPGCQRSANEPGCKQGPRPGPHTEQDDKRHIWQLQPLPEEGCNALLPLCCFGRKPAKLANFALTNADLKRSVQSLTSMTSYITHAPEARWIIPAARLPRRAVAFRMQVLGRRSGRDHCQQNICTHFLPSDRAGWSASVL